MKGTFNKAKEYRDIREILQDSVKNYPDNSAFIIKHKDGKNVDYEKITYKRFMDEINFLGTALIDLGLKDTKVAIIGKNRYEWMVAHFAVINGTGISVPLDKGLPAGEIENSLIMSGCETIVFEKDYLDTIKEIKNKNTTNLKKFICMDDIEDESVLTIKTLLNKGKTLLENGDKRFLKAEIDNEKLSILVFTSGTTSASKGVMLSHKNIVSNIYGLDSFEKIYPTDVNMAFLPFHHTFGSTGLLYLLHHGATNVFCDGIRHIQENLKEYKVTMFICVPLIIEAMYKKIMTQVEKQGQTKKVKFGIKLTRFLLKFGIDIRRKVFKQIIDNLGGSLRFIISGASGIDRKVAEAFNDFGFLTVQGYGLTETSPVLFAENENNIKYGSVGLPLINVESKIENKNEDGIGEIVAKGPNVMLGYYENKEETDKVLKDGWFYTGDLGYFDKDGFLFITGRKKNVIVLKNGKNIYPEEIEQVISNLSYVAENMVYGKEKDDDLLLSAKIVYNKEYMDEKYPGKTEEEIKEIIWKDIKEINKTMPQYKHVKNIVVTDKPMIKTTTAKIKRFEEMKNEN